MFIAHNVFAQLRTQVYMFRVKLQFYLLWEVDIFWQTEMELNSKWVPGTWFYGSSPNLCLKISHTCKLCPFLFRRHFNLIIKNLCLSGKTITCWIKLCFSQSENRHLLKDQTVGLSQHWKILSFWLCAYSILCASNTVNFPIGEMFFIHEILNIIKEYCLISSQMGIYLFTYTMKAPTKWKIYL